jgi:hypothetical protein
MNPIGTFSLLSSSAAQPFAAGAATSVDAGAGPTGDAVGASGAAIGRPSEAFSTDYAMSLLAKITHAGADQALTLIQGLMTPRG